MTLEEIGMNRIENVIDYLWSEDLCPDATALSKGMKYPMTSIGGHVVEVSDVESDNGDFLELDFCEIDSIEITVPVDFMSTVAELLGEG